MSSSNQSACQQSYPDPTLSPEYDFPDWEEEDMGYSTLDPTYDEVSECTNRFPSTRNSAPISFQKVLIPGRLRASRDTDTQPNTSLNEHSPTPQSQKRPPQPSFSNRINQQPYHSTQPAGIPSDSSDSPAIPESPTVPESLPKPKQFVISSHPKSIPSSPSSKPSETLPKAKKRSLSPSLQRTPVPSDPPAPTGNNVSALQTEALLPHQQDAPSGVPKSPFSRLRKYSPKSGQPALSSSNLHPTQQPPTSEYRKRKSNETPLKNVSSVEIQDPNHSGLKISHSKKPSSVHVHPRKPSHPFPNRQSLKPLASPAKKSVEIINIEDDPPSQHQPPVSRLKSQTSSRTALDPHAPNSVKRTRDDSQSANASDHDPKKTRSTTPRRHVPSSRPRSSKLPADISTSAFQSPNRKRTSVESTSNCANTMFRQNPPGQLYPTIPLRSKPITPTLCRRPPAHSGKASTSTVSHAKSFSASDSKAISVTDPSTVSDTIPHVTSDAQPLKASDPETQLASDTQSRTPPDAQPRTAFVARPHNTTPSEPDDGHDTALMGNKGAQAAHEGPPQQMPDPNPVNSDPEPHALAPDSTVPLSTAPHSAAPPERNLERHSSQSLPGLPHPANSFISFGVGPPHPNWQMPPHLPIGLNNPMGPHRPFHPALPPFPYPPMPIDPFGSPIYVSGTPPLPGLPCSTQPVLISNHAYNQGPMNPPDSLPLPPHPSYPHLQIQTQRDEQNRNASFAPHENHPNFSSQHPLQQEGQNLSFNHPQTPGHVGNNSVEDPISSSGARAPPQKFHQDPRNDQHVTRAASVQTRVDGEKDHPQHVNDFRGTLSVPPPTQLPNQNPPGDSEQKAFGGSTAPTASQQSFAPRPGKSSRSDEELPPPSDDEMDTADYVSRLHEFAAQRNSIVSSLRCQFEDVSGTKVKRWKCIFSGKLMPYTKGDDLLSREGISGLKKKAKHKAAKLLLELLMGIREERKKASEAEKEKEQSANVAENTEGGSKKHAVSPQESSEDLDTSATGSEEALRLAYCTLESMWSQGHLSELPQYTFDLLDEKWKATVVVKTRADGEITVSALAPQKKIARQKVSLLALQKLSKMKVEGAEALHSLYPDTEGDGGTRIEAESIRYRTPNVGNACANTEEVTLATDREVNAGTKGVLRLPNEYKVEVAISEAACEKWLTNHVGYDSHIGLYLDSHPARCALERRDCRHVVNDDKGPIKWPIIYVCTDNQGLLICAKCRTDCDSSEVEESHYWVPGALADVLECDTVVKHGHSITEGVLLLKGEFGVDCVRMDDVERTSLAITGVGKTEGGLFNTSLPSLCSHWLQKQLSDQDHVLALVNHPIENKISDDDKSAIKTAILSAYASLKLPRMWNSEAKRKKLVLHGSGVELMDLTRKLMTRP